MAGITVTGSYLTNKCCNGCDFVEYRKQGDRDNGIRVGTPLCSNTKSAHYNKQVSILAVCKCIEKRVTIRNYCTLCHCKAKPKVCGLKHKSRIGEIVLYPRKFDQVTLIPFLHY